jgi:hypothetical protein
MSLDTIAAAAATILSATLATMILTRGLGAQRAHLLAWGASLGLFAVGSAALTLGTAASWTPAIFRLYYAAGAVLTVPFLGLGSLWLHWPRAGRAAGAVVGAFSIAAVIVVGTATLREPVAPEGVPEGKELLGPWPRALAVTGNVVGTALVVSGTVRSIARVAARRRRATTSSTDRRMLQANLLITLGVVVAASGGAFLGLGEAASKAVPLAVAVSLIFAGYLRSQPPRPTHMAP